jgi:hypothetical protein
MSSSSSSSSTSSITEEWIKNQISKGKVILTLNQFNSLVQGAIQDIKQKQQWNNNNNNNSNSNIKPSKKSKKSVQNNNNTNNNTNIINQFALIQIQQQMLPHKHYMNLLRSVLAREIASKPKFNKNFACSQLISYLFNTKKIEEIDNKSITEATTITTTYSNISEFLLSNEGLEQNTIQFTPSQQQQQQQECLFTGKQDTYNIQYILILNTDTNNTPVYTVDRFYFYFIQAIVLLNNINEYLQDLILTHYRFDVDCIPLDISNFPDEFKQELENHRKTWNTSIVYAYEFANKF